MTSHADRVREAERAVVEAAVAQALCTDYHDEVFCVRSRLHPAVDALLSLRAATCPTCGGTGEITVASTRGGYATDDIRCPAGCERGKRRTT